MDELLEERVESSRGRRNVRGVKRKIGKFKLRKRNQRLIPAKIDYAATIQVVGTVEEEFAHAAAVAAQPAA